MTGAQSLTIPAWSWWRTARTNWLFWSVDDWSRWWRQRSMKRSAARSIALWPGNRWKRREFRITTWWKQCVLLEMMIRRRLKQIGARGRHVPNEGSASLRMPKSGKGMDRDCLLHTLSVPVVVMFGRNQGPTEEEKLLIRTKAMNDFNAKFSIVVWV